MLVHPVLLVHGSLAAGVRVPMAALSLAARPADTRVGRMAGLSVVNMATTRGRGGRRGGGGRRRGGGGRGRRGGRIMMDQGPPRNEDIDLPEVRTSTPPWLFAHNAPVHVKHSPSKPPQTNHHASECNPCDPDSFLKMYQHMFAFKVFAKIMVTVRLFVQVRLLDEQKEPLGVMSSDEAMAIAEEAGLDMVMMSPEAHPPAGAYTRPLFSST
jgi:hypothetical protein